MNLFDLHGRKALVTGGGSPGGLGRGMARGLKEQGAEVVILSRSARVFDVAREDGFTAIQADLTDRLALKKGWDEALEKLGTIDILVNAHGMTHVHPVEGFPIDVWDRTIETNLTSVFSLCQLAGSIMLERGYGKIINIASMLTFSGGTVAPAYAVSKGGVGQLTKALANEWAGRGVNVNAIAPGFMETEMTAMLRSTPTRRDAVFARIPAGRWGHPDDLKGVVIFLASKASDYVHGAIIPVDGGFLGR